MLARRLAAAGPGAPVVILIHGYKFDPWTGPPDDPHRSLFAFEPEAQRLEGAQLAARASASTPSGPRRGLCIGFGWPAVERASAEPARRGAHRLRARLRPRRRDGAAAGRADRADPGAGAGPAGRPARAQPRRAGGAGGAAASARRAGADHPARALRSSTTAPARRWPDRRAPRPPSIYNVTSRANDVYDAAFETFAPRRNWGERAVGLGLRDPRPYWLDLQLDRPDVTDWINAQGVPLTPAHARLCHWSFYTRGGAFEVYQAILRRRPGWDIPSLRAAPCFAAQEPRWSRLALRLRRRRHAAAGAARAWTRPRERLIRRRAQAILRPTSPSRKPRHDRTDRSALLADAERLEGRDRAARDGPALPAAPGEHRRRRPVPRQSSSRSRPTTGCRRSSIPKGRTARRSRCSSPARS